MNGGNLVSTLGLESPSYGLGNLKMKRMYLFEIKMDCGKTIYKITNFWKN